jgi:hypothetical protein
MAAGQKRDALGRVAWASEKVGKMELQVKLLTYMNYTLSPVHGVDAIHPLAADCLFGAMSSLSLAPII